MLRFRLKMLNRKHYGHVFVRETYAKKLTVRKYLKMIRMPLTFVYLALKGCFLSTWFTLGQLIWSDLPKSAKC